MTRRESFEVVDKRDERVVMTGYRRLPELLNELMMASARSSFPRRAEVKIVTDNVSEMMDRYVIDGVAEGTWHAVKGRRIKPHPGPLAPNAKSAQRRVHL